MSITNPDGSDYAAVFHPDPDLTLAIVKAWGDSNYRSALLTDESERTITHAIAQANYQKTKRALQEIGLDINEPVVMTLAQYERHYTRASWQEVVFVLPDQLGPGWRTLPAAKLAMAITPCGM